jgi:hypothetical protein
MRERIEQMLERRTGGGMDAWSARVNELGDVDEARLRPT